MPTDKRATRHPGRSKSSRLSVLVSVEPTSLQRLIGYVLQGESGLRVVFGSSKGLSVSHRVARLAPNVIVVNHRVQRKQPGDVLTDLRRLSPASTLILLTSSLSGSAPPQGAADVCLPEDAVVARLLPMIRKAALRAADRTPQPASAGLRT